jgi:hypothetical protein
MTEADRTSILLDLAAALRTNGSWTGETHVQKAAYLMQELLGVPSGFRFVLYKHGPFSFDLRSLLTRMEVWGGIRLQDQPYPYGPKIVEGETAGILRSASDAPQTYASRIRFVAEQLGKSNVAELERVATALFIERDVSVAPDRRNARLTELKPHITPEEASNAFVRLNEIRDAAVARGFTTAGGCFSRSAH